MIVAGIDPGATGAVAVLYDSGAIALDIPTAKTASGKTRIVPSAVQERIMVAGRPDCVWIEAVHAMPGQGVSSMFAFGRSLGVVEGVVGTLQIPVRYVQPAVWKRAFGLIGADKDAARTVAAQRFPGVELTRKKDIGRADALLIALYGLMAMRAEGGGGKP